MISFDISLPDWVRFSALTYVSHSNRWRLMLACAMEDRDEAGSTLYNVIASGEGVTLADALTDTLARLDIARTQEVALRKKLRAAKPIPQPATFTTESGEQITLEF